MNLSVILYNCPYVPQRSVYLREKTGAQNIMYRVDLSQSEDSCQVALGNASFAFVTSSFLKTNRNKEWADPKLFDRHSHWFTE